MSNVKEIREEKERIENLFNNLIESEFMPFVNKHRFTDINLNVRFDSLETEDYKKVFKGRTDIRVEL